MTRNGALVLDERHRGALLVTGDLVELTTRLARFTGWQI
jgi:hypothetical protein